MIAGFNSLTARLLLGSALLLPLFLGTSGWYLERTHRRSIEAAEVERLQLQVLTLLSQVEYNGQLTLPEAPVEARYAQPNSGLYAMITDASGARLWLSPSAVSLAPTVTGRALPGLAPGERNFQRLDGLYELSYQVLWQTESGTEVPLIFTVMESAEPIDADVNLYRRSLLFWLGGSALLLLACQLAVLAWGLRPLRQLAADINAVESGSAESLAGDYPHEVQALTDNLNVLLHSERQRRERVRNTLGDLAHSLKTPLAVLRSADPVTHDYPALVHEQTNRMEQIVSYQLQRAVGGSHKMLQLIPVRPLVERLCRSLEKVYAQRALEISIAIDAQCLFRGDERDLLEMLGNVMDNACKYGRQKLSITALGSAPDSLQLTVEDDGEGIPRALRELTVQRGARADRVAMGQGIGLAVVFDIIASYRGKLIIADSALGGASVVLRFP